MDLSYMLLRNVFLLAALVAVILFSAGCVQNPPPASPVSQEVQPPATGTVVTGTPPVAGTIATTTDLIAFVRHAAEYARGNGREKAIATFNNPEGPFVSGNLYIFAEDYNGTALAEPLEPGMIGTNIQDMTDPFGIPLVKNLQETARYGRGFVSYAYPNPGRNDVIEPKLSVVEDVDGTYYVGAGIYVSDAEVYPSVTFNTTAPQPGVDDLVAFVKEAVAYARENGKEKSLSVFNDPGGPFVRGQLVVMAFDDNGTSLAGPPYSPELSANRINLINYHDPDGVATIRGMRDLSREGGGFFYTVVKVTVDRKEVFVPKINYAEPVDGGWWLFSTIIDPDYARIAAGDIAGMPVRNHTRTELYDLVNRAVAYAKENGREKALETINDSAGPFVTGDFFVWAETTDGILLADPYWKSGIGQNFIDYTDPYGMEVTKVGIEAMQNGTGFSHAIFPDTAVNGSASIPKLIYMKPVDDTWWIGGGIYGISVQERD